MESLIVQFNPMKQLLLTLECPQNTTLDDMKLKSPNLLSCDKQQEEAIILHLPILQLGPTYALGIRMQPSSMFCE